MLLWGWCYYYHDRFVHRSISVLYIIVIERIGAGQGIQEGALTCFFYPLTWQSPENPKAKDEDGNVREKSNRSYYKHRGHDKVEKRELVQTRQKMMNVFCLTPADKSLIFSVKMFVVKKAWDLDTGVLPARTQEPDLNVTREGKTWDVWVTVWKTGNTSFSWQLSSTVHILWYFFFFYKISLFVCVFFFQVNLIIRSSSVVFTGACMWWYDTHYEPYMIDVLFSVSHDYIVVAVCVMWLSCFCYVYLSDGLDFFFSKLNRAVART